MENVALFKPHLHKIFSKYIANIFPKHIFGTSTNVFTKSKTFFKTKQTHFSNKMVGVPFRNFEQFKMFRFSYMQNNICEDDSIIVLVFV